MVYMLRVYDVDDMDFDVWKNAGCGLLGDISGSSWFNWLNCFN